jgi:hypothetical protein
MEGISTHDLAGPILRKQEGISGDLVSLDERGGLESPYAGGADGLRRAKDTLEIRIADWAEGGLGNLVSFIPMENPMLDAHAARSTAALVWSVQPLHVILPS